jgi:NAD(P)-dependent dehydrogenase (short-subunit alcohol dehydrogenase family)
MTALHRAQWRHDRRRSHLAACRSDYARHGHKTSEKALVNPARNYASFLSYHHIRVNTVHPTGVNTMMCHNSMIDDYFATANPEDLKTLVNAIPVNEIEPEDVAGLVLWLYSDDSRYSTGNAVRIDAGASLR